MVKDLGGEMTYSKTIVCFAASRKPGGVCVAGKQYLRGHFQGWIRPIGKCSTGAIDYYERLMDNDCHADVLDVVDIDFDKHEPIDHQKENYLITKNSKWSYRKRLDFKSIQDAVDKTVSSLWHNDSSLGGGKNDRVRFDDLQGIEQSLYLIKPEDFTIFVMDNTEKSGPPKKHRAEFFFNQVRYNLSITDPWVENKYTTNGKYALDECLVCISLGDEFKGFAYKLVAAVITPER